VFTVALFYLCIDDCNTATVSVQFTSWFPTHTRMCQHAPGHGLMCLNAWDLLLKLHKYLSRDCVFICCRCYFIEQQHL